MYHAQDAEDQTENTGKETDPNKARISVCPMAPVQDVRLNL